MASRYSHILTLIAAILAFVPVMGVDWLLDNYVRVRERVQLQSSLEAISERIETGAYDGIASLRTVLATAHRSARRPSSPTCTRRCSAASI